MEYGSTPYIGMTLEKNGCYIACVQSDSYIKNSALDVVIGFYEPYLSFSSVVISNKTVSGVREHR